MMLWRGVLLFSLIICAGCSSAYKHGSRNNGEGTRDNSKQHFQMLAQQKYRDDVRYSFNTSRTAVLCIRGAKNVEASGTRFFLYSLSTKSILFEEVLPAAEVSWLDDERIRVKTMPGIVRGDEVGDRPSNIYIYNIRLRAKESPAPRSVEQ